MFATPSVPETPVGQKPSHDVFQPDKFPPSSSSFCSPDKIVSIRT